MPGHSRPPFFGLVILLLCGSLPSTAQVRSSMAIMSVGPPEARALEAVVGAPTACEGGFAAGFACSGFDLMAFVPLVDFGASGANDIWGWTDAQTGKEIALVGLREGTGFVDISDPANPVILGVLPTQTVSSTWRDIKVYQDHAFVVSEAPGHGIQVFDLTQLRAGPVAGGFYTATAHYTGIADVHNVVINEETGYAYTVGNNGGGTTCAGGLHMIDVRNPLSPTFAGCYSGDGYTHDAQCVIYRGPDTEHLGKEICVASNEDTITIVDVSNKTSPVQLARVGYPGASYVHQGWLSEDHAYFYQNDELDEYNHVVSATRTVIWDLDDLDNPVPTFYSAPGFWIDHNNYVRGDRLYQANYRAGLRVLDISNRLNPVEVGYFDTYTPDDANAFGGAWSTYPYFESGTVVISSIGEGLFIVRPIAQVARVTGLVTGTEGSGRLKRGTALVTLGDNLGNPVEGAVVSGRFSGTLFEDVTGTTAADGTVFFVTSGTSRAKGFEVAFCVDDVRAGSLNYNPSQNASPDYACAGDETGATHLYVSTVETGTQGGRFTRGTAVVTVLDDLDRPVAGATVSGTFGGEFSEDQTATTNGSGEATLVTVERLERATSVEFCVSDVAHSLPYEPASNGPGVVTCTAPAGDKLGSPGNGRSGAKPSSYALSQNYPNPFNPSTVLTYALPEDGHVTLTVFTVQGREIDVLVDGFRHAGSYRVTFDASSLSAGVYLVTMKSGGYSQTRRMTLLK